jgi:hypothetical protein
MVARRRTPRDTLPRWRCQVVWMLWSYAVGAGEMRSEFRCCRAPFMRRQAR